MSYIKPQLLKPIQILNEIRLEAVTTARSLEINQSVSDFYVGQVANYSNGDVYINRLNSYGMITGRITIKNCGLASNIGLQKKNGNVYIWVEKQAVKDTDNYFKGKKICRVLFKEGAVYDNNNVEIFDLLPSRKNLSVALDIENNLLLVKSQDNTNSDYFTGYKLEEVEAKKYTKLFEFKYNIKNFRSFAVQGDYIYVLDSVGAVEGNSSIRLHCLQKNGSVIYNSLLTGLGEDFYYREGVGLIVKKTSQKIECYTGVISGDGNDRKYSVYKYVKYLNGTGLILKKRTSLTNVKDGAPGKDGEPGKTLYTWLKYADDILGNGMSDSPTDKKYMGWAYNRNTEIESDNPSDYQWSRIKGEDGTSVKILGELENMDLLPPKGVLGDAYLIKGDLWVWTEKSGVGQWINAGRIQGPAGADGESVYSVVITSTGGTIFKNGMGSTILEAKLYYGSKEVDNNGGLYVYSWKKFTNNNEDSWSSVGKKININQSHVDGSTTFQVTVSNGLALGQITISDLTDVVANDTPPENPIKGSMWYNTLDGNTYVWDGTKWVISIRPEVVGGNNKILNSTFSNGEGWTFTGESINIDNNILTPNGYNTIHIKTHNLQNDFITKIDSEKIYCGENSNASLQWKVFLPLDSTINDKTYVGIKWYDSNNLMLEEIKISPDLELKNKWQTLKREKMVIPSNASYCIVSVVAEGNIECWYGEPQLEWGTICTDFKPSTKDMENEVDDIINRVVTVEQNTEHDKIVNTVTSSDEFNFILQNKVNNEDIVDLATKEELQQYDTDLKHYIDKKIGDIDMSNFVNKSELEQTQENFNFIFEKAGGVNLLVNSIGYSKKYTPWKGTLGGGKITPYVDGGIKRLGVNSGWMFNKEANDLKMYQSVNVNPNKDYTFSMYIKKEIGVEVSVDIYKGNGIVPANKIKQYIIPSTNAYNYDKVSATFNTDNTEITVLISRTTNNATNNTIITSLMLNQGKLALNWTSHSTEVYNANTKIDDGGITVYGRTQAGETPRNYTTISPDEFGGYYDTNGDGIYEEIFALKEDYTLAKKVVAKEEVNIGKMKIVAVEGDFNGIAFVPLDNAPTPRKYSNE